VRPRLSMYGLLSVLLALAAPASAEEKTYSFGVLPQRSAVLTAQYWNPVLEYVTRKSGVNLKLKVAHTAPECDAAIAQGVYDFAYAVTIFLPSNSAANYQAILRPEAGEISGQIVTLEDSTVRTLAGLEGKAVGFPWRGAFVAYAVTMDHLLREGITVSTVFGGNQEGIMGQLTSGKVIAAGVNNQVMSAFAARQGVRYRVLWESQPYHAIPVSVHPRIENQVRDAVRQAFADMNADPEGRSVLEASAKVIKQPPPYGFVFASQGDYQNYIYFYRHSLVKETE
jgi:phosphonate transport system substrate-binding protein